MATQVEQMPGPGGRLPQDAYPWEKWLDGRAWHLERGRDYTVATTAMRAYVYRAARRHEVTVHTVRDTDDNGITIRAEHVDDAAPGSAPAAGNPRVVR